MSRHCSADQQLTNYQTGTSLPLVCHYSCHHRACVQRCSWTTQHTRKVHWSPRVFQRRHEEELSQLVWCSYINKIYIPCSSIQFLGHKSENIFMEIARPRSKRGVYRRWSERESDDQTSMKCQSFSPEFALKKC